jgi:hypothetical protein
VVVCLWIGITLPIIKDGFFALHHLFIKRKVAIGIFAFRHYSYRTVIVDCSSVRICLNANIPIATFLFINRWCKAKKPSLMMGRVILQSR